MPDMDKTRTTGISVEQLRQHLDRKAGCIHGCIMVNLDEIVKLAIAQLTVVETANIKQEGER